MSVLTISIQVKYFKPGFQLVIILYRDLPKKKRYKNIWQWWNRNIHIINIKKIYKFWWYDIDRNIDFMVCQRQHHQMLTLDKLCRNVDHLKTRWSDTEKNLICPIPSLCMWNFVNNFVRSDMTTANQLICLCFACEFEYEILRYL